jgi:hypothetical protein
VEEVRSRLSGGSSFLASLPTPRRIAASGKEIACGPRRLLNAEVLPEIVKHSRLLREHAVRLGVLDGPAIDLGLRFLLDAAGAVGVHLQDPGQTIELETLRGGYHPVRDDASRRLYRNPPTPR